MSRSVYTSFELTAADPLAELHEYASVPAADEPLPPRASPTRFRTRRAFIDRDEAYGWDVGVPSTGEIP